MESEQLEWVSKGKRGWKRVRDEFVEEQEGQCGICRRQFDRSMPPQLDHCHRTGFIRGALCGSCNVKLGWYENQRQGIEDYLSASGEFMAHRHERWIKVGAQLLDDTEARLHGPQPKLTKEQRKRERIRHYHLNKEARKAKKAVTGSAGAHAAQENAPAAAPSVSYCDGSAA